MDLMNGIEVLNSCAKEYGYSEIILAIVLFICGIILIFTGIKISDDIVGVGMGLVLLSIFLVAYCLNADRSSWTEYDVTVSDEVNLNEFMEKYEIISTNGKIYTIKEKEME